jgi:hypothetical protein
MTDTFPIIKVPYADDIFVNHIHVALKGVISEVSTGAKVTPISYAKGTSQNIRDLVG